MSGARRAAAAGALAFALAAAAGGCGDSPPEGDGRAAATDTWTELAPSGLARTEVGAARVGRYIFVVGGFEESAGRATRAVERYDIETDSWRRVRSMPAALHHPAATSFRGRVFVHGGYTDANALSRPTAALLAYDPRRDRWSRLPSSPTRRAAHALVALRGRLFAVGGRNDRGDLRTLEAYNPARRRWSRGPGMPTAREHIAGVAAGGRLYVLGGRVNGALNNLTTAERYDPERRRWSRLPPMDKARSGIAAAAARGRVVVFGGEENGGTISEVEAFDPRTREWSQLPRLGTPRHGLGGAARGGRVYAIQGGPTPGFDFSRTIEALDLL